MRLWTSDWGKRFLFSTLALATILLRVERELRYDDWFHTTMFVVLALFLTVMSVSAFLVYRSEQKSKPGQDE